MHPFKGHVKRPGFNFNFNFNFKEPAGLALG